MNQPRFFRILLVLTLVFTALPSWAQLLFQEGVHYRVLSHPPSNANKVIEFFSYSCPHCYSVDPLIEGYLDIAPAEYSFERVPVSFGRADWQKSAEVYTLAGLLGKREALHEKVFEKIHKKRSPFGNDSDVKSFFIEHGVDEKKYEAVLKAPSTESAFERNETLARQFKISSVPTLIVRDAYQVELSRVDNSEQLKELINFLMRL